MAEKIACAQTAGCEVSGPTSVQFEIPAGKPVSRHKFFTLDQLIFQVGTFKVEQKIVEDGAGTLISLFNPTTVTVKNNQEIRHFKILWDFVANPGIYTYQIIVDDKVISAFKISILAGK